MKAKFLATILSLLALASTANALDGNCTSMSNPSSFSNYKINTIEFYGDGTTVLTFTNSPGTYFLTDPTLAGAKTLAQFFLVAQQTGTSVDLNYVCSTNWGGTNVITRAQNHVP